MPKQLLDSQQLFIIGESKQLGIKVWDEETPGTDISAATATIEVRERDGTEVLASGSATVTGTTLLTIRRRWTPGAIDPGLYYAICTVTYGSDIYIFQWGVDVRRKPAPQ